MGSVKDLVVFSEPTRDKSGVGAFRFTNDYSVFDWGKMPDPVPYSGASRCMMGAYFFEQLNNAGVRTHYIGLGENADHAYTVAEAAGPMNTMMIELVRVIKPLPVVRDGKVEYDYSFFTKAQKRSEGNFVIPAEIIYRNTLPRGSSVFRRLRDPNDPLTLAEMGLAEEPQEGQRLSSPFFDVSTKFEEYDRYPGWAVMQRLMGLSNTEKQEASRFLTTANSYITEGVSRAGLQNDDGKIELGYDPNRRLMIVDALGTLDECRFTYPLNSERIDMSKEIPRQWYRYKQPDWVEQIDAAKKSGEEDWKSLVKSRPEPMPRQLVEMLSYVYASVANAVLERQVFDAPTLDEVARDYQRFRDSGSWR